MADVPLPEPDGVVKAMWNVVRHGPNYDGRERDVIAAARAYAERYAAAVSTAKDAEIAALRAELLQSLADNAALRERVRVLEDARPEPDCRTCKRAAIQHGVTRCTSPYFCTNADHYEPLPPVRLWRTAP